MIETLTQKFPMIYAEILSDQGFHRGQIHLVSTAETYDTLIQAINVIMNSTTTIDGEMSIASVRIHRYGQEGVSTIDLDHTESGAIELKLRIWCEKELADTLVTALNNAR